VQVVLLLVLPQLCVGLLPPLLVLLLLLGLPWGWLLCQKHPCPKALAQVTHTLP
jgi:hypothetical protein